MRKIFKIGLMTAMVILLSVSVCFAVANTCTSKTGTVTGTDPSFVVTYKPNANEGAILYLKFTQGTAETLTLTFEVVNIATGSATEKYKYPVLTGAALSAYTMTVATTGSYRIPLPLVASDYRLICNVTFSAGNQGGAVVANFVEP